MERVLGGPPPFHSETGKLSSWLDQRVYPKEDNLKEFEKHLGETKTNKEEERTEWLRTYPYSDG